MRRVERTKWSVPVPTRKNMNRWPCEEMVPLTMVFVSGGYAPGRSDMFQPPKTKAKNPLGVLVRSKRCLGSQQGKKEKCGRVEMQCYDLQINESKKQGGWMLRETSEMGWVIDNDGDVEKCWLGLGRGNEVGGWFYYGERSDC